MPHVSQYLRSDAMTTFSGQSMRSIFTSSFGIASARFEPRYQKVSGWLLVGVCDTSTFGIGPIPSEYRAIIANTDTFYLEKQLIYFRGGKQCLIPYEVNA